MQIYADLFCISALKWNAGGPTLTLASESIFVNISFTQRSPTIQIIFWLQLWVNWRGCRLYTWMKLGICWNHLSGISVLTHCFLHFPDYSELPPLSMTNGPKDQTAEDREEEENGYDYPKPRLPQPPARRTLSELGGSSSSSSSSSSCLSSTAAFSRLSLDSDAGAAACEYTWPSWARASF